MSTMGFGTPGSVLVRGQRPVRGTVPVIVPVSDTGQNKIVLNQAGITSPHFATPRFRSILVPMNQGQNIKPVVKATQVARQVILPAQKNNSNSNIRHPLFVVTTPSASITPNPPLNAPGVRIVTANNTAIPNSGQFRSLQDPQGKIILVPISTVPKQMQIPPSSAPRFLIQNPRNRHISIIAKPRIQNMFVPSPRLDPKVPLPRGFRLVPVNRNPSPVSSSVSSTSSCPPKSEQVVLSTRFDTDSKLCTSFSLGSGLSMPFTGPIIVKDRSDLKTSHKDLLNPKSVMEMSDTFFKTPIEIKPLEEEKDADLDDVLFALGGQGDGNMGNKQSKDSVQGDNNGNVGEDIGIKIDSVYSLSSQESINNEQTLGNIDTESGTEQASDQLDHDVEREILDKSIPKSQENSLVYKCPTSVMNTIGANSYKVGRRRKGAMDTNEEPIAKKANYFNQSGQIKGCEKQKSNEDEITDRTNDASVENLNFLNIAPISPRPQSPTERNLLAENNLGKELNPVGFTEEECQKRTLEMSQNEVSDEDETLVRGDCLQVWLAQQAAKQLQDLMDKEQNAEQDEDSNKIEDQFGEEVENQSKDQSLSTEQVQEDTNKKAKFIQTPDADEIKEMGVGNEQGDGETSNELKESNDSVNQKENEDDVPSTRQENSTSDSVSGKELSLENTEGRTLEIEKNTATEEMKQGMATKDSKLSESNGVKSNISDTGAFGKVFDELILEYLTNMERPKPMVRVKNFDECKADGQGEGSQSLVTTQKSPGCQDSLTDKMLDQLVDKTQKTSMEKGGNFTLLKVNTPIQGWSGGNKVRYISIPNNQGVLDKYPLPKFIKIMPKLSQSQPTSSNLLTPPSLQPSSTLSSSKVSQGVSILQTSSNSSLPTCHTQTSSILQSTSTCFVPSNHSQTAPKVVNGSTSIKSLLKSGFKKAVPVSGQKNTFIMMPSNSKDPELQKDYQSSNGNWVRAKGNASKNLSALVNSVISGNNQFRQTVPVTTSASGQNINKMRFLNPDSKRIIVIPPGMKMVKGQGGVPQMVLNKDLPKERSQVSSSVSSGSSTEAPSELLKILNSPKEFKGHSVSPKNRAIKAKKIEYPPTKKCSVRLKRLNMEAFRRPVNLRYIKESELFGIPTCSDDPEHGSNIKKVRRTSRLALVKNKSKLPKKAKKALLKKKSPVGQRTQKANSASNKSNPKFVSASTKPNADKSSESPKFSNDTSTTTGNKEKLGVIEQVIRNTGRILLPKSQSVTLTLSCTTASSHSSPIITTSGGKTTTMHPSIIPKITTQNPPFSANKTVYSTASLTTSSITGAHPLIIKPEMLRDGASLGIRPRMPVMTNVGPPFPPSLPVLRPAPCPKIVSPIKINPRVSPPALTPRPPIVIQPETAQARKEPNDIGKGNKRFVLIKMSNGQYLVPLDHKDLSKKGQPLSHSSPVNQIPVQIFGSTTLTGSGSPPYKQFTLTPRGVLAPLSSTGGNKLSPKKLPIILPTVSIASPTQSSSGITTVPFKKVGTSGSADKGNTKHSTSIKSPEQQPEGFKTVSQLAKQRRGRRGQESPVIVIKDEPVDKGYEKYEHPPQIDFKLQETVTIKQEKALEDLKARQEEEAAQEEKEESEKESKTPASSNHLKRIEELKARLRQQEDELAALRKKRQKEALNIEKGDKG